MRPTLETHETHGKSDQFSLVLTVTFRRPVLGEAATPRGDGADRCGSVRTCVQIPSDRKEVMVWSLRQDMGLIQPPSYHDL